MRCWPGGGDLDRTSSRARSAQEASATRPEAPVSRSSRSSWHTTTSPEPQTMRVQFHAVGALVEREAEGGEGVLRSVGAGAPVSEQEHGSRRDVRPGASRRSAA